MKKDERSFFNSIKTGNIPRAKEYLKKGININTLNDDLSPKSALYYAIAYKNKEAVEFLLKEGINVNIGYPSILAQTGVHTEVKLGKCEKFELIKLVIEKGANVNALREDEEGRTLLGKITDALYIDGVAYLLEKGASIQPNEEGCDSAMHIICNKIANKLLALRRKTKKSDAIKEIFNLFIHHPTLNPQYLNTNDESALDVLYGTLWKKDEINLSDLEFFTRKLILKGGDPYRECMKNVSVALIIEDNYPELLPLLAK